MSILSASRRTDIPTYHSEWFIRRLEEGKVGYRNPMYPTTVYEVPLNKNVIDCIVLWTKDAIPMMDNNRMQRLNNVDIPYYFQYTATAYLNDMERLPHTKEDILQNIKTISSISNGHVVWRYDPIIFTQTYTPAWHVHEFNRIASILRGYTNKCVISFVDGYMKNQNAMQNMGQYAISQQELVYFCGKLASIAHANGMEISTCAEVVDLNQCGIVHGSCIDKSYIEQITGKQMRVKKDKAQRAECGCVESIDIGVYDTCANGCEYCYACRSKDAIRANMSFRNDDSLLLCSTLKPDDKIMQRKCKSLFI